MELVKQYRWLLLVILVIMAFTTGPALYAQQVYIEDYDDQGIEDQNQDDWGEEKPIGQQPPATGDQKMKKTPAASKPTPSQPDTPEETFDSEKMDTDATGEQPPAGEYDPDAPQIYIQEYEKEEKIPKIEEDTPYAGACYLNYGFSMAIKGGFRQSFLTGEGSFNNDFFTGTRLNFRRDLNLNRVSNSYVVGGNINIYSFRLGFEASHGKFTGTRLLSQSVMIEGTTFGMGTRLRSNIKFDWFRTTIGFNIYADRYFGIGPALKVDVINAKYEFKGLNQDFLTGIDVKARDSFVFALVNPGIQVDFSFSNPLVFTLAVYGIVFDASNVYIEQFYVSLSPRYYLSKSFFVFGEVAYEYLHLESGRSRDFNGNVDLHSWFASAGVGVTF